MAKINTSLGIEAQQPHAAAFLSLIASLGVLLCLIASLLGIKIWWFKHRLTFDQSSTQNGAAGGTQPAVVVPRPSRSRRSKDKRLSQQVCETVVVHGVFRQRKEDELDYERPNQLPPVRIRQLSQSTPSLLALPMPTPSLRNEDFPVVSSSFFSAPPTRVPPRPPKATTMPAVAEREMFLPTTSQTAARERETEFFAQPAQNINHNTAIATPLRQAEVEATSAAPPQAPKRLNRSTSSAAYNGGAVVAITPATRSERKFLKAKASTLEPIYRPAYPERRLTGFYRHSLEEASQNVEEAHGARGIQIEEIPEKTEQFGDRRPTGYIKYEEVDVEPERDLADFHEKWDNMQLGRNERPLSTIPLDGSHNISRGYLNYAEANAVDFTWNEENLVTEGRLTGYPQREDEHIWNNNNDFENNASGLQQRSGNSGGAELDFEEFNERIPLEYPKGQDEEMWKNNRNDFDNNESKVHQQCRTSPVAELYFDEFTERRPTGYPKKQDEDIWHENYNEIENNESGLHQGRANLVGTEFNFEELTERRPTGYPNRQDEHIWSNNESTLYQDAQNTGPEEIQAIESECKAEEVKDYIDGMDIFERPINAREIDGIYVNHIKSDTNKPDVQTSDEKATTRSVKFLIPYDDEDEVDNNDGQANDCEQHDSEWQLHRRPTGYARDAQNLWADLEESVASHAGEPAVLECDQHLWLEMEKDILQTDFASNIEHEFNKIRHNYEENEGDFLDVRKQKQLTENMATTSAARRDLGFGKSIEEDWDSFEQLEESLEERTTTNRTLEAKTAKVPSQKRDYVEPLWEKENLKYQPDEGSDLVERKTTVEEQQYCSGAYQSHNAELYQETFGKQIVTFEKEEAEEQDEFAAYKSDIHIRRPTGFVKRDLDRLKDELAETETSERRRVKPRQKVTFDFNTEEYYLPANESEDDDDDSEEQEQQGVLKRAELIEMPKPMQRITKMHYTEKEDEQEYNEDVNKAIRAEHPITPSILFSTQVSREDSPEIMALDSWSAIRQHRVLTEEFQQISLEAAGVASIDKMVIKPATRQVETEMRGTEVAATSGTEPPKAAFRNPLAQVAVVKSEGSSSFRPPSEEPFIKPRMRGKKIGQSAGERFSFTECSTSGSTEA